MRAERWERMSTIFHRALSQPEDKRPAFLDGACADDRDLRDEVERLLAAHANAGAFGEKTVFAEGSAPLATGSTIGPYRITALLGIGGMGEVYRAHDERLGREVALKVLPRAFTRDCARLARIEREARALAALNHPNVATIYGFEDHAGTRALVMEFVDGEMLAQRIEQARTTRHAIPLKEALAVARQIALGLESAHDKGIVHRDLKPANIMITSLGTAKVLDFGIAKEMSQAETGAPDSTQPHVLVADEHTNAGIIMGTVAYMSPEQARGLPVDRRTDIWAFGCVLFEMLTGKKPFAGRDATDTVARILHAEPDFNALPADTPGGITRLLAHCFEKDRARRLAHMAVAAYEIDAAVEAAARPEAARRPRGKAIAATLLAFLSGAALMWLAMPRETPPPAAVNRLLIDVAPADELGGIAQNEKPQGNAEQFERLFSAPSTRPTSTALALSPDGKALVFSGVSAGRRALYLRRFDAAQAAPIPDTDGATTPFYSPDGRWIGFWSNGELRRVALAGGPAQSISATPVIFGASWGDDDRIVFASAVGGLWSVPASGGSPTEFVTPDESRGEVSLRLPQVLPGADAVLFTVTRSRFPGWNETGIHVYSRRRGAAWKLLDGGADARYAPTGHLLFMREAVLMAAPFDLGSLEIRGAAVAVLTDVMQSAYAFGTLADTGAGQFAFNAAGTLVYVSGGVVPDGSWPIVRVDRSGHATPLLEPRPYATLRVSPDGMQLAASTSGRNRDIWLHSFSSGTLTRRPASGRNLAPIWSHDGAWITYASASSGPDGLQRIRADGSGAPELLLRRPANLVPGAFMPGDREILYYQLLTGAASTPLIWRADLAGNTTPLDIAGGPAGTGGIDASPDGHWVAYHSADSGKVEVYVQAYPGPGPRYQVSVDGGLSPVWRADGRELFYVRPAPSPASERVQMLAVAVEGTKAGLHIGAPKVLFEGAYRMNRPARSYDVSPDGTRFYLIQSAPRPVESITTLHVVQNWLSELTRLTPH